MTLQEYALRPAEIAGEERPNTAAEVLAELHDLVCHEAGSVPPTGTTPAGGHKFENLVSQRLHRLSKEWGFRSNPARYTLDRPTFSGIRHQIDSLFILESRMYLLECKRRKISTKEQMHYFNSIISDYVLGSRLKGLHHKYKGVFLSTAEVDSNSLTYAISFGITVVDPIHPPVEVIRRRARDPNFRNAVGSLLQKLPGENPLYWPRLEQEFQPADLTREYEYLASRWKSGRG
jgi:hypothetical protein